MGAGERSRYTKMVWECTKILQKQRNMVVSMKRSGEIVNRGGGFLWEGRRRERKKVESLEFAGNRITFPIVLKARGGMSLAAQEMFQCEGGQKAQQASQGRESKRRFLGKEEYGTTRSAVKKLVCM